MLPDAKVIVGARAMFVTQERLGVRATRRSGFPATSQPLPYLRGWGLYDGFEVMEAGEPGRIVGIDVDGIRVVSVIPGLTAVIVLVPVGDGRRCRRRT